MAIRAVADAVCEAEYDAFNTVLDQPVTECRLEYLFDQAATTGGYFGDCLTPARATRRHKSSELGARQDSCTAETISQDVVSIFRLEQQQPGLGIRFGDYVALAGGYMLNRLQRAGARIEPTGFILFSRECLSQRYVLTGKRIDQNRLLRSTASTHVCCGAAVHPSLGDMFTRSIDR
jgi:hypothetical protein